MAPYYINTRLFPVVCRFDDVDNQLQPHHLNLANTVMAKLAVNVLYPPRFIETDTDQKMYYTSKQTMVYWFK